MTIYLGAHLAVGKGYLDMVERSMAMDGDTFAFFLRNPRGGKARELDEEDMADAKQLLSEKNFGPLVAHAPYTLNPASDKERVREFAEMVMQEDLDRMEYLPGNYYNFHPGSHVGQGVEKGLELVIDFLKKMTDRPLHTGILLETMAGKGTELGRSFEEIKIILEGVNRPDCMGVLLDTCHVFDGGYDLKGDLDGVLAEFDAIIGLEHLKAIHLNDSLNVQGSRKDRHALLGEGNLGWDTIMKVVNHPRLAGLPMILETPTDEAGHAKEIAQIRRKREQMDEFGY